MGVADDGGGVAGRFCKRREEVERQEPAAKPTEAREPSGQVPVEELSKMLSQALEKEDYEKAAKIRDELNKRNG